MRLRLGLWTGCVAATAFLACGGASAPPTTTSDPSEDAGTESSSGSTSSSGAPSADASDGPACTPRWRTFSSDEPAVRIAGGAMIIDSPKKGDDVDVRVIQPTLLLEGDFDIHIRLTDLAVKDNEGHADLVVVTKVGSAQYRATVGYLGTPVYPPPPKFFGLEASLDIFGKTERKQLAIASLGGPTLLRLQRKGPLLTSSVEVAGTQESVTFGTEAGAYGYQVFLEVSGQTRATFDDFVIEGTAMKDDFSCDSVERR